MLFCQLSRPGRTLARRRRFRRIPPLAYLSVDRVFGSALGFEGRGRRLRLLWPVLSVALVMTEEALAGPRRRIACFAIKVILAGEYDCRAS